MRCHWIEAQHSQSVADFGQRATETLDRLNQTGEAEVLTVDGEPRAVLISPAAYEDLTREAFLAYDVACIRQSIRELKEGKGRPASEFFDEVRAELLAMQAAQAKGGRE